MTAQQMEFDTVTEADNARHQLLLLLAEDHRSSAHVRAVAEAIAVNIRPGESFSANEIRRFLPPWIAGHLIGPAFYVLRRKGAIRSVGSVSSTGRSAHGKPVATYEVTT